MDLSQNNVRQSVKTLLCLPKPPTSQLVSSDDRIELIISVKKVPIMKRVHVGRFILPHSIFNADSNVCFFVKDSGPWKSRDFGRIKDTYMKMLKEAGIEEIKEVMPLKQLKLEFKPFEARRRLSDAFDGYLADERIYDHLRPLLGKFFYNRNRAPISAKIGSRKFGPAVQKALRTSLLNVANRGPSSMMTIGVITTNSEDEIVNNIMAVWEQLNDELPGGSKNVRSMSIKTAHSKSVPVFNDLDYSTHVPIPDLRNYREEPEAEEIDTVSGAKVVVYSNGRVRLIRKQKNEDIDEEGSDRGAESSEDEKDDKVIQELIALDEAAEFRRKRKLERKATRREAAAAKKARRPLLEAHAATAAETKSEKTVKAVKKAVKKPKKERRI